jgi:hypothetical protein
MREGVCKAHRQARQQRLPKLGRVVKSRWSTVSAGALRRRAARPPVLQAATLGAAAREYWEWGVPRGETTAPIGGSVAAWRAARQTGAQRASGSSAELYMN